MSTEEESLTKRISEIVKRSTHYVVIGARDEGKTSFSYHLLELHKPYRPCFVYRHPKPDKLPDWIHNISKAGQLPPNGICFVDESSNDFDQFSYNKRTNIYLRSLLQMARHKGQSWIFANTTTNFLNRNFLYMIDVFIMKKPTIFQEVEERKVVRLAYAMIHDEIGKNEFYWYDGKIFLKGAFERPAWFTDELSRAYSNYEPERI